MSKANCQWCEKEIGWGAMRSDAQFCSDGCRTKCHNAKKKAKRESDNVVNGIMFIQNMMLKSGDLGQEALSAMQTILAVTSIPDFDIKCSNCGQKRLYMPTAADECSFCHQKAWSFEPKPVKV